MILQKKKKSLFNFYFFSNKNLCSIQILHKNLQSNVIFFTFDLKIFFPLFLNVKRVNIRQE